jgi:hypothetical protein
MNSKYISHFTALPTQLINQQSGSLTEPYESQTLTSTATSPDDTIFYHATASEDKRAPFLNLHSKTNL